MVTVAFSCRSSIESGRPYNRPSSYDCHPFARKARYRSFSACIPLPHRTRHKTARIAAEHLCDITGEIPSDRFAGSIIFQYPAPLICFGSGRSIKNTVHRRIRIDCRKLPLKCLVRDISRKYLRFHLKPERCQLLRCAFLIGNIIRILAHPDNRQFRHPCQGFQPFFSTCSFSFAETAAPFIVIILSAPFVFIYDEFPALSRIFILNFS